MSEQAPGPVAVGTIAMAEVILRMEGQLMKLQAMRTSELLVMLYSSVSLQQSLRGDPSTGPRVQRIVGMVASEVDRRFPVPSALIR